MGGTSATCGDYNGDGWLDLHVNQWDQDGTGITAVHTKLFRNTGDGFFEDVSSAQGFVNYASDSVREVNFSSTFVDNDMGTAFGDLDKNGYLDWFVTSVWGEVRNSE